MFELSFHPLVLNAVAPSDEDIKNGAEPEVTMNIVGGIFLPTQQGPAPIPAATFSFPLNRENAKEIGKKLIEESERLPSKPDIPIARNLNEATQQARFDAQLRGGHG